MTIQTIDIGTAPNDGTGDPIRTAFEKVNLNFESQQAELAGKADAAHIHQDASTSESGFLSPSDKQKLDNTDHEGPRGITYLDVSDFDTEGRIAWDPTWAKLIEVNGVFTRNLYIDMPAGDWPERQVHIKRSQNGVGPFRLFVEQLGPEMNRSTSLPQPTMWVDIRWDDATRRWERGLFENVPRASVNPGITDLDETSFSAGVYAVDPATVSEHVRLTNLSQDVTITLDRLDPACFIDQQIVFYRADNDSGVTATITGLGGSGTAQHVLSKPGEAIRIVYRPGRNYDIVEATSVGDAIAWGQIIGALSNQADLQAALDAKAATGHVHNVFGVGANGFVPGPGTAASDVFLAADGVWRVPSVPAGSVAWGSITGALSSQADLQAALDAKLPTSQKGAANGVASLDGASLVPDAQIPALTISKITGLQTALDGKLDDALAGAPDGLAILDASGLVPLIDIPSLPISQTTGLQTALDGKASSTHGHAVFGISADGFVPQAGTATGTRYLADDGVWRTPATDAGSVAWGSITGTLSAQGDLQAALNAKLATSARGAANGVAALDASTLVPPTQIPQLDISKITGLQAALDASLTDAELAAMLGAPSGIATLDGSTLVPVAQVPNLAISKITGLQTALDGKISTSERAVANGVASLDGSTLVPVNQIPNLAISKITGLQTALDGKVNTALVGAANGVASLDASTLVPVAQVPQLAISKIAGLQTELDNKAAANHTHSLFTISASGFVPPSGTAADNVFLAADGVWRIPSVAAGSVAWGSITGTLSSQGDLQAALNGKSDTSHTHAAATPSVAGFMSAADKTKLDGFTDYDSAIAVSASRNLAASDLGPNKRLEVDTSAGAVTLTIPSGVNAIYKDLANPTRRMPTTLVQIGGGGLNIAWAGSTTPPTAAPTLLAGSDYHDYADLTGVSSGQIGTTKNYTVPAGTNVVVMCKVIARITDVTIGRNIQLVYQGSVRAWDSAVQNTGDNLAIFCAAIPQGTLSVGAARTFALQHGAPSNPVTAFVMFLEPYAGAEQVNPLGAMQAAYSSSGTLTHVFGVTTLNNKSVVSYMAGKQGANTTDASLTGATQILARRSGAQTTGNQYCNCVCGFEAVDPAGAANATANYPTTSNHASGAYELKAYTGAGGVGGTINGQSSPVAITGNYKHAVLWLHADGASATLAGSA